jgi:hypothetical protein
MKRASLHPSHRERAQAAALAFAVLLALPSAAHAAGVAWGGSKSGLPWASGASSGADPLESFRGRKLDVRTMFVSTKYWSDMIRDTSHARKLAKQGSKVVVALGLMPRTHTGQHAQCGRGKGCLAPWLGSKPGGRLSLGGDR